jgi:hypothetical protein
MQGWETMKYFRKFLEISLSKLWENYGMFSEISGNAGNPTCREFFKILGNFRDFQFPEISERMVVRPNLALC